MIFVTTGTQLPFPRLISAMDALAPKLGEEVIAQVGPDTQTRQHIEVHPSLPPSRFAELFGAARVVVAHAGIGSILSAKQMQRPIVLVPRKYALGEHRNDHQFATAREIEGRPGYYVAWETSALLGLLRQTNLDVPEQRSGQASESLIQTLRAFIDA